MSILNVDKIQPIGGGSTITVDATDIQALTSTITASKFVGSVSATGISTFNDDSTFYGGTSGRNLFWDKSENALEFGDYTYAKFGVDEDLTIWSNNNASAINNIWSSENNDMRECVLKNNNNMTSVDYGITDGCSFKLCYNKTIESSNYTIEGSSEFITALNVNSRSLHLRITSLPNSDNPINSRESLFWVSSFAEVAQSFELFQVTPK